MVTLSCVLVPAVTTSPLWALVSPSLNEGGGLHGVYTLFQLLLFKNPALPTHYVAMGKSLPFLGISFSFCKVGI